MKENTKKGVTRREFLGLSALGLASLTILPSWAVNGVRIAPSDRVVLGFVGLGQQGLSDFKSFSTCPGVQVAACCDVDSLKRERFKRRVEAWQKSLNVAPRCDMYEFYEDVLDRKDIDVIEVATPDHWHALVAIHACQSGKDVYCQKPLAYTITEGLAVARAVRDNNRVFQIGSLRVRSFRMRLRWFVPVRSVISKRYTPVSANPPSHWTCRKWMSPVI